MTLVVYESYFGNTKAVAEAIAKACQAKAVAYDSPDVAHVQEADLLIFGCPTRAFRPTKGMTGFWASLPKESLAGKRVAVFDTRMDAATANSRLFSLLAKAFGYAAVPLSASLVRKGAVAVADPIGLHVEGSQGPLAQGEVERAVAWALRIVQ